MLLKIKNLTLVALAGLSLMFLLSPTPALADCASPQSTQEAVECGACDVSGNNTCDPEEATNSINDTITTFINILSVIVGAIAVVMIVVAGFRYVTSGGDSTKVASAKTALVYAIVGLIIVALAQSISKFVLNEVTEKSSSSSNSSNA